MANYFDRDRASLLHPTYGDSARDIRKAVGISRAADLSSVMTQIDRMKRTVALDVRDFRGIYLEGEDQRVTPDHNKFIGMVCPDGSVNFSPVEGDPHTLQICSNPEFDIATICDGLQAAECFCQRGITRIDTDSNPSGCELSDNCNNILSVTGNDCINTTCTKVGDTIFLEISNPIDIVPYNCGLCVTKTANECTYTIGLNVLMDGTEPVGPGANLPDDNGFRWARVCACDGNQYWFRALRIPNAGCC